MRGFDGVHRGGEVWLADGQRDDVMSGRPKLAGADGHLHRCGDRDAVEAFREWGH